MPVIKRRKTKLSEEVVRKQRPALDIQKSAVGNAGDVADDLEPFLMRGLPEGQTLPDVALFQVILGNVVHNDSDAMEAADEAHFDAFSLLNRLQLSRDDYKGRLVTTLTDIRDTFDTAFGRDSCQRVLGLGVELPAETLRVRRLSDRVVRLLSAEDFELPPAVSDIAGVDVEKWLRELTPDLTGLHDVLDRMSEAKRDVERKLEAKSRSIETYEQTFLRGSQLLEVFYKVSGNEHLAVRLRPTIPKSRSATAKGDEGSTGGSSDSTEESTEPPAEGAGEEPPESSTEDAPESRVRPDRPPSAGRSDGPTTEVRPDRPPADERPAQA